MSTTTFNELRAAAADALRAHDKLLEVWRLAQESKLAPDASADDVLFLRDLIIRRIYPVNAFGLLVQINWKAAIEVLISRYLGLVVDPDTKFGGFEFELASMLDDLREAGGIDSLGTLVRHPQFSLGRIADPRVQRVFSDVLDIEDEEITPWAQSQREGQGDK